MKLIIRSETVTAAFEGLRLDPPLLQAISVVALIFGYLFGVGDRTQIFLILILILTRHCGRSSNPRIAKKQATGIEDNHSQRSVLLKKGGSQIGRDGRNIQS